MTEKKQAVDDYFAALERLKSGRPIVVSKGTRITNDAVALEAGRGKGTIKKSRPVFAALIAAIEEAAEEQASVSPEQAQKARLDRIKGTANQQRLDVDALLASLVSRLFEIHELRTENRELEKKVQDLTERLARVSKDKVVDLRAV